MTFDDLAKKLGKLPEEIQADATKLAAETARTYAVDTFRRKAFDGQAWKPTNKRRGSTLVDSGNLRNSVRVVEVRTDYAVIGAGNSHVRYARVHNEGFNDIVSVRAHSRKNKKTGKVYKVNTFKRHMRIIQRQFMGDSRELNAMIVNRVILLIQKKYKQ